MKVAKENAEDHKGDLAEGSELRRSLQGFTRGSLPALPGGKSHAKGVNRYSRIESVEQAVWNSRLLLLDWVRE
jgi:hypothetical protein